MALQTKEQFKGDKLVVQNNKVIKFILRNHISLNGEISKHNRINLEWWNHKLNIGDTLANVVYNWMLERKNCAPNKKVKKTYHLMTVGSIIAIKPFDAVIWGSGLHTLLSTEVVFAHRRIVKYDVRAVRGPITKYILEKNGYQCKNSACGDPVVLMPNIYAPSSLKKKYNYSIIRHVNTISSHSKESEIHEISVETADYKSFIDEVVASELVISSSLHGIIIAEAYGIPAIFLNENGERNSELLKYYDWYYSTKRYSVIMARSLEEALSFRPMEIPNLDQMRTQLLASFPYDIWL